MAVEIVRCSLCNRGPYEVGKAITCDKCKSVFYCNVACRAVHFVFHKDHCAFAVELSKDKKIFDLAVRQANLSGDLLELVAKLFREVEGKTSKDESKAKSKDKT